MLFPLPPRALRGLFGALRLLAARHGTRRFPEGLGPPRCLPAISRAGGLVAALPSVPRGCTGRQAKRSGGPGAPRDSRCPPPSEPPLGRLRAALLRLPLAKLRPAWRGGLRGPRSQSAAAFIWTPPAPAWLLRAEISSVWAAAHDGPLGGPSPRGRRAPPPAELPGPRSVAGGAAEGRFPSPGPAAERQCRDAPRGTQRAGSSAGLCRAPRPGAPPGLRGLPPAARREEGCGLASLP